MSVDMGEDDGPFYNPEDEKFDVDVLHSKDPFEQFEFWMNEAKTFEHKTAQLNAMALATAAKDGQPSIRMIVLKSYSNRGFSFFTSEESKKGKELEENPQAALLFYWPSSNRQVRVQGKVEPMKAEQSDEIFQRWPKISQICSVVAKQSVLVPNREFLEKRVKGGVQYYKERDVGRPEPWKGYLLVPTYFEFWQGQSNRVHDRLVFSKEVEDPEWVIERLAP